MGWEGEGVIVIIILCQVSLILLTLDEITFFYLFTGRNYASAYCLFVGRNRESNRMNQL